MEELEKEIWCSCGMTDKWKMAWGIPTVQTYNSESEGIRLLIEKSSIPESAIPCLNAVAKKQKLKMMSLDTGYFVIYTPRKA